MYDKNQFGVGAVKVLHNTELCLPSTKVVAPPPTTTTEPTTTTTAARRRHQLLGTRASTGPYDIAAGPDGALWFTNYFGSSIGRHRDRRDGHQLPEQRGRRGPTASSAGTDGAMWFANTANSTIGRVTTDGTGVFTSYGDPRIASPVSRRGGPGRRHVVHRTASNQSVGWVTPNGTVNVFYSAGIANPQGITAGPDGAMWFANFYGSSIGRVTARR